MLSFRFSPPGQCGKTLAVNQLRKGGFNGTIRYLSE
nr:MAG TPA: Thymidylate kinase [Caudoviricetes sp.]